MYLEVSCQLFKNKYFLCKSMEKNPSGACCNTASGHWEKNWHAAGRGGAECSSTITSALTYLLLFWTASCLMWWSVIHFSLLFYETLVDNFVEWSQSHLMMIVKKTNKKTEGWWSTSGGRKCLHSQGGGGTQKLWSGYWQQTGLEL